MKKNLNKTKIVSLSILLITLFSTNCFATTEDLKTYEVSETVALEEAEQYKQNIEKEITIDNAKYELQDISEHENKNIESKEKEQTKEKIVYTNNKYDVLNMFESKIEMTEDGMSGTLELQNDSLDIKVNDSYKEQYKVSLTEKYENVPTNELNDVPKTIKENGITYYLINPIWKVSKVEKVEGQDIPVAYNGEMQYEGIKERTIVNSYLATVNYEGTLEKENVDSITFKITYKEIPQEIEEEESKNYIPVAVATAGTGIVVVSGILLWRKKNKNKVA